MKSRHPEVRLIQCLPKSNKGLKNDFLIVSGEWHDGLPCPTRERQPGGALGLGRLFQLTHCLSFVPFLILTALCLFDDFADRHAVVPNFDLVNKDSLDKILKAKVFVNLDGQLRVAHLILVYTPISSSFQAPKCVIKARNPRLHRKSVAVPGFLLPKGVPIPEGTLTTQPIVEGTSTSQHIPKGMPKVTFPFQHTTGKATSSQPSSKEKDEEEERQKKAVDSQIRTTSTKFLISPCHLRRQLVISASFHSINLVTSKKLHSQRTK